MKKIVALLLLGVFSTLSTGCLPATAHSGRERWRKIAYNMSIDGASLQEDIDHVLLLRGGSTMSLWNIQYQ